MKITMSNRLVTTMVSTVISVVQDLKIPNQYKAIITNGLSDEEIRSPRESLAHREYFDEESQQYVTEFDEDKIIAVYQALAKHRKVVVAAINLLVQFVTMYTAMVQMLTSAFELLAPDFKNLGKEIESIAIKAPVWNKTKDVGDETAETSDSPEAVVA